MNVLFKTIVLSITMLTITIIGDYIVKKASTYSGFKSWKFLIIGGIIYLLSAYGWFWLYKYQKFITIGAIHSFGIVIMTVLASHYVFKEKISSMEVIALILGLISVSLMLKAD